MTYSTRSIYAPLAAVLTLVLFICACGFQLKGQQHYAFKRLYIAPSAQTSQKMTARLKQMITAGSGTVVVNDPNTADAILTIEATRSRNSKSLSAHGATEEYALEMIVDYQLKDAHGALLLGPDRLTVHRSMTYNNQYTLAKEIESEQLYDDIENDAIDQLLRRLENAPHTKS